ncbi:MULTISPECIES: hypothetical protein [unclassified Brenneria]|uniref:hypothetical protein n=1 Tax=unclassified Brenneria TaxID=2634434 RepID=UPI0029C2B7C3|nr:MULTISPECIES: hypothetical protein [unclassified Brenneria]MDX5626616.1 hypothetical protein [Brenneria sp. L3-3Z]MDX5694034.1 hypothetical protein [Brenneria sp. L4-2C]MEE3661330.1 hypothetical protein [Brenneria sp. g21c3]
MSFYSAAQLTLLHLPLAVEKAVVCLLGGMVFLDYCPVKKGGHYKGNSPGR